MPDRTPASESTLETPVPALVQAVQLFAISGFAFAQPLFGVLASGPAFFVAHGAGPLQVVVLVVAVLTIPPAALFTVVRLVHALSPPAGRLVLAAMLGTLLALTVLRPIDQANTLRPDLFALALVGIATLSATAYLRLTPARTFVTYLGFAPLLFAGVFLFFSPASGVVFAGEPDTLDAGDSAATHVIMLVFDELPLGAILDRDGNIDGARYPGFARLADTSTWYRNATTVSPGTVYAIPSLVAGLYPPAEMGGTWPPETWAVPPVAARYPRSLFTMLAGSHSMHVHEWITDLCPRTACDGEQSDADSPPPPESPPSFAQDVGIVISHQLLPTRLADEVLPPIAGAWAGFGRQPDGDDRLTEGVRAAEQQAHVVTEFVWAGQFEAVLTSLESAPTPQLWFAHERLPHRPTEYVREGIRYPRHFAFDYAANERGHLVSIPYLQQFLLQVQFVDQMVDRLLDRMESEGLVEDSMLIVVSDHGLAFRPGGHPRALEKDADPQLLSDVLPVPLFVKYPGQSSARVDERWAQLPDVLPTVADTLNITLPDDWRLDGRSLMADPDDDQRLHWQPVGKLSAQELGNGPLQLALQAHTLFGRGGGRHDLYAMGPFRDFVARAAAPLTGDPLKDVAVEPHDPAAYKEVSVGSGFLPLLYEGTATGLEPGAWVAVAVNGRVAGTGPVIADPELDDRARVKVMLDPSFIEDGRNDVDVYLVDEADGTLRPIPQH
jgi:hypothetical protein